MRTILLTTLLCLAGCTKSRYDQALLMAGDNQKELEKVVSFYEKEPLKKKAAIFLIENMPFYYAYTGISLTEYYMHLDSLLLLQDIDHPTVKAFYDSIFKINKLDNLEKKYDLQHVSADYLINNIEKAFSAWQSPWAKELNFDEFCEYILPYRIGNEIIENWRDDYSAYYRPLIAEIDIDEDSSAFRVLEKISQLYIAHRYNYPVQMPDVKPSTLKHLKIAPCRDYANCLIYIGRALGIPITFDFTPQWANRSMGHEWNALLYKGKSFSYILGEGDSPGDHIKNFTTKLAKVYRKTYSPQKNSLVYLYPKEEIPLLFRTPLIKDVTKEYLKTIDLEIIDLFQHSFKSKIGFLAVFDNQSWVPISWGEKRGKKLRFKDIGCNVVYLPVYYNQGICHPAQYPVWVNKTGNCTVLKPDTNRLRNVVLTRKYPDFNAKGWAENMRGGYFEFSKHPDFDIVDKRIMIDTVKMNFQSLPVNTTSRFIRYIPPENTAGNIAELEIYSDKNQRLTGKPIGTYLPQWEDQRFIKEKAFDGDVLTYAACEKDQPNPWLGVDLGKTEKIGRITFLPRTDDNFIKDGEIYELYYWNKNWVSLGRKTGSRATQQINYSNVPSNCLLLLKNHTRGKEERIFTYENGKQIWW